MTELHMLFIALFGLGAFALWIKSLYEVVSKKNPYGVGKYGLIYGGFVFADYLIFGAFFTLASIVSLILYDFILFLLINSVFWLVRSVGEALYWFLQQFSPLAHKNPPERFFWNSYIKQADAIWIINQVIWQCMTVIFAITTIYLSHQWLQSL